MLGQTKPHPILFVCSGQGARARIAEYYTGRFAITGLTTASASFEMGPINNLAAMVMREVDPDITLTSATSIFERFANDEQYALIVCLCDDSHNEQCPNFRNSIHKLYGNSAVIMAWNIADFRTLDGDREEQLQAAREIREKLAKKVTMLIEQLRPIASGNHLDIDHLAKKLDRGIELSH